MTRADLPDNVMADLLEPPDADETILTRWSHCTLTDSPFATLGRGQFGDIQPPAVNARIVARYGYTQQADYLVVGMLGEGGMGVVFDAEQVYFGRRVALKMIKPALATDPMAERAFFREAVITSRLNHPGIIPVLDFGKTYDGRALYAMMQAGGTPWDRVICGKTLEENLAIFDRVADVVAYAHDRGILHRDIKPANVLLGNHGEVWLGDWGVALPRLLDGTYSHAGPAGTPAYMAPEMARCDTANIGPASDVYLLGAVLFEIITGAPPHTGENAGAALRSSAQNSIRDAQHADGLLRIACKAMAAQPAERYAAVGALQEAVRNQIRLNESLQRQQQADAQFAAARRTGDYELFQQAIAGYGEAIALAPDNDTAHGNRDKTLAEYAGQALENEEIDLAESIVAQLPKGRKAASLTVAIAVKREALEKRSGRQKIQRIALLAMGVLLLIGSVVYFWRSSDIEQAIESGKRFDSMESDAYRRGRIMDLQFSLPPNGVIISQTYYDIPDLGISDEEHRRLSVQRGNRDRIIDELTEILTPVNKACEDVNAIKSDEDVTEIYQMLQELKPQLQEKIEEASTMKENGDLAERQADAILRSLTYLATRPERYEPPAR